MLGCLNRYICLLVCQTTAKGGRLCYNSHMFQWFSKHKNYLPPTTQADGTRTRIFVGVSGGVDSSVSAAILKRKGYDVTGVFIKTYYPPELKCDWRNERLDALRVCEHLSIPFLECDMETEYKEQVFDYMIDSYTQGITPNPDIFCNKYVKFGGFLQWAMNQGAHYIATGHYAQHIITDTTGVRHALRMGQDHNKDQTYFLYQLEQSQLEHALFPVGHLHKDAVRRLAKKYGLFTAEKKDSQGICFVGPVDMHEFLKTYITKVPGDVLDTDGKIIGHHDGSFFLTIGQRTGFEILPEHRTPHMPRMFIVAKDSVSNTVTVSPNKYIQNTDSIMIENTSWIGSHVEIGETVDCRIRHRGALVPVTLQSVNDDCYVFSCDLGFESVASGQSLVLYRDNICLGGGIII